MNKIVIRKRQTKRDKQTLRLPMKRVRDADGKFALVPTVDAEDPDFGLKLEAMFRLNVAKAIKATKKSSKTPRHATAKRG